MASVDAFEHRHLADASEHRKRSLFSMLTKSIGT